MICIWCKRDFPLLSREHIIPEALGGNELVVLEDAVCTKCNNSLAPLDQALLKQFEIITVMRGIPRKRGKKPTIVSWKGFRTTRDHSGLTMHLNGGPGVIDVEGQRLNPVDARDGISNIRFEPEKGKLSFQQSFGNDIRFHRGLYKIGLTLVARFLGSIEAADTKYDRVREFVAGTDKNQRMKCAMDSSSFGEGQIGFSSPFMKEGTPYPMFEVTILGVKFLLDVDPDQRSLNTLWAAATLSNTPFYVFPPSLMSN